jgi:DNA-binding CsgD family transcriptional regulator/tetratricopeptide (TPR) repeat protein
VGRDHELDRIGRALGDTTTAGVVIAGPRGAGKTRLAREALALGETAGFATARVQATRASQHIPLGALAPVVPEAAEVRGDAEALSRGRRGLLARAEERPLLLLVDDADRLDPASAALVAQVGDDPRVFVVSTVPIDQPVPDAVTALWKDLGAARIDLGPLDEPRVGELLEAVLAGPVSTRAVARLTESSRGLPLALRELVTAALAAGRLVDHGGVWELRGELVVSPRLAELVGQRLDGLGEPERRLIATLALCGPLPRPTIDELGLAPALHELDRRRLLDVDDTPAGPEVLLAHPLYGDVELERWGTLSRRDLLGRGADALAAGEPGAPDLRAVLWSVRAGRAVDPAVLTLAAGDAYRLGDYERAGELAAAAWSHAPSADAGHLVGFSWSRAGRFDDADRVLTEAATLAGSDRERALVAMARSENLFRGLCRADDAFAVLDHALTDTAPGPWRDELRAHRAALLTQQGRPAEALTEVEPLLGPGTADRPFVRAAYAAGPALVHGGRGDEALALAARALPVHERIWDHDVFQTEPGVHHVTSLVALIELGRLDEAAAVADLAVDLTRRAVPAYGFAWFSMLRGDVALYRGRIGLAARSFRDALGPFRDGGYVGQQRWCLAGLALAEILGGDLDTARWAVGAADELAGATPVRLNEAHVVHARGWLLAAEGDVATAHERLADGAREATAAGETALATLCWHAVARLGGADVALDPLAEVAAALDGELAAARLAHTRALADGDGSALDIAADRFAAMGSPLWAAEAAAQAVDAHRRAGRGRAADASRRRASGWLGACEGARPPAVATLDAVAPLTDREREVAHLAARRLTSKEIAARLGVSRRTVDNLLQRAYRKLGVSSRLELVELLGSDAG